MNKKTINSAVFFTLLLWLAAWLLVFRRRILVKEISPAVWGAVIGINILLIVLSRWLVPVFDGVMKVTAKIGVLIFGMISTLVFFLILTPISLVKRLMGGKMMEIHYDRNRATYYEEWEAGSDISNQY